MALNRSWHDYNESLVERGRILMDISFIKSSNKAIHIGKHPVDVEKAKSISDSNLIWMTSASKNIKNIAVSDFMTRSVKTIKENETMRQACKLMYQDNIGSIVILKKFPWTLS